MNQAQRDFQLERAPACILADGPEETDGDGGYQYTVCFGDDEGEPITHNLKAIWHLWEHEAVRQFCRELAAKYNLEIIDESMAP